MSNGNLPDGWTSTTIGEITSLIEKVIPQDRPTEPFTYLDISSIDNSIQKIVEPKRYLGADAPSRARQLVKAYDVLFSTVRTYLQNIALVPEIYDGQIASTGFSVLRASKGVLPKYLFYYTLTDTFLNPLNELQRGTSYPAVRDGDVRVQPFPLPPLPEQERIVAKIEELFTQLDAGTAALKRVRAGLKRYKASVLKAAVEGRLLPSGHNGAAPVLGELPDGWRWATVAELAANEPYSITDGPFGSKLKTEHYTDAGPRVMRLQNIGEGEFRDAKAHISQDHFATLKRHRIFAGDLVIAGLGESLPRACIIPEYVGDAIVKADCIRYKPNPNIADPKYLLFALNSETVKKLVAKVVHGIGRPRMNQQEIKAIPIPLPPLAEQLRIVAEVEQRLSVAAQVETVLAASVMRAARLRQSVLKSAFEGKLS